ncbi:hypothetical protein B0H13DRAFT_2301252 [Mycena leptocephala]|nr:hypothetical protein B0H13DRAFT_2301252 [Mycena leptocephala]
MSSADAPFSVVDGTRFFLLCTSFSFALHHVQWRSTMSSADALRGSQHFSGISGNESPAAQDSSIPTAGPLFENTCGRRGCVHIFKYAGTDPFQSLAVLVAQHAPYCIGRISATHRCDTEWEPTAEILARFYNPVDDPAMFHNFVQCPPSDVMDVFADSELSDLTDDEATDDDSDYDVTAESIGVPVKRNRKATSTPRTTTTRGSNATVLHTAATAPPMLLAGRKKKGARTMAQRCAVLEDDLWTTTVAPHHVVCRGCKHTIRLDGRSFYYPGEPFISISFLSGGSILIAPFEGLWEKHRERCKKVKDGRAELCAAEFA